MLNQLVPMVMSVPEIAKMIGSSIEAIDEMIEEKGIVPYCQLDYTLLYGPTEIVRIDKLTLKAKAKRKPRKPPTDRMAVTH